MSCPLALVIATIDLERSAGCRFSWAGAAQDPIAMYTVASGVPDADNRWMPLQVSARSGMRHLYTSTALLGVIPAYALGVQKALEEGAEIIACLHDDLRCDGTEPPWDQAVLEHFAQHPQCGLLGFGGALGLGDDDIYQVPYNPMQLARKTFGSNMRHAEAHGQRWTEKRRVSCLDGFSLIGRREFWQGFLAPTPPPGIPEWDNSGPGEYLGQPRVYPNLFQRMAAAGLVHHCYDSLLGCYAVRLGGWEVWFLPIPVHHLGGQTAVADSRYLDWAIESAPSCLDQKGDVARGDAAHWLRSHRWGYEHFRDVLPLRLPEGS